MTLQERIYTFIELGKDLQQLSNEQFDNLALQAKARNNWFTYENVQLSIESIIHYLQPELLLKWLSQYDISHMKPGKVGVIMAGNTPAEGFHDFMCVLLSGHTMLAKLSPQDEVLIKNIAQLLISISPEFEERIIFADRLNNIDALIATVRDKTVNQFYRYFGQIPHIIRSHRKSCAILNGNETEEELLALGNDILQYFGLGNRNVSKLYVPAGYSFEKFFRTIEPWSSIAENHRYANHYDYNKSILLVNQQPHLDNGFLLLTESDQLLSPVSVVNYVYYSHTGELTQNLEAHRNQLQNILSQNGWYPGSIPFGMTTKPALDDYEGGVDTMQFLSLLW